MNKIELTREGTYANNYKITVDGVAYRFMRRHDTLRVSGIAVVRKDSRGGLKYGSKRYNMVLAAIEAAS